MSKDTAHTTSAGAAPVSGVRITELDGVRGLAIAMVLIHHFVTNQTPAFDQDPGNWFSYIYIPSTAFWSGVDLFFVLSGFLIGGIILDHHRRPAFLRVFWIRRVCRILPVYTVVLTSCVVMQSLLSDRYDWLFSHMMPWWSYCTFTQNILMAMRGGYGGAFLDVTWSLAIEEQFYLIAPIAILLAGRKKFVSWLLPLSAVALALRLVDPGLRSAVLMPYRMDSLMAGVMIAVIFRSPPLRQLLYKYRTAVLGTFAIMLVSTAALILSKQMGRFQYSWFCLLYSVFIIVCLLYRQSALTGVLRSSPLCFLGTISYGLYMYHNSVNGLLHGYCFGEKPINDTLETTALTSFACVASIAIASLSYFTFEKRFHNIGRRCKYTDGEAIA